MTAKTLKGKLYEPDTLSTFRNSFQRILDAKNCKHYLKAGVDFLNSRKVLASRRKELTKLGKGNKPNATRPLTDAEVNHLYQTGYFGSANPTSLQRTVWWQITNHFGQRARDEARQLKFGDIKIEREFGSGEEYLVWDIERCTKTRNGERPMGHKRSFEPKAFATNNDRCPVALYKLFVSHRPESMLQIDSPFFLAVRYHIDYNFENVWYLNRPLGKNSIGEFLSKASKLLPATSCNRKKVSNHSARKTAITNLMDNNVNPLHVGQLSGHKNMDSLRSYHTASFKQQKEMSMIVGDSNKQVSSLIQPSSNLNTVIPHAIQQDLMTEWNPILPPTFQGAQISNCIFNINIYNSSPPNTNRKRKRIFIEDDD